MVEGGVDRSLLLDSLASLFLRFMMKKIQKHSKRPTIPAPPTPRPMDETRVHELNCLLYTTDLNGNMVYF